jgi:hypothetical protein
MRVSPCITLFDKPGGSALAKHPGGRESDARLYQTQDVKIDSDCSFAKRAASRSDNHGSFRYAIKDGGPVSRQVRHLKILSLLKAESAKHRSKFAALSPVMMVATR